MAWRRMQQFSFGLWLLPESLGAAPRRSLALARGLVRAGCPLERIIAVEGNAARIGQHLAGHVDGCPPLRVFTAFRHARVPKGCKNCVKDISENDDPLRSWAAARCSRLPWQPPFCCCTRTRRANPLTTSAARTGGCHRCVIAADADDASDPDLVGGVARLSRGCRRAGAGPHHQLATAEHS